MRPSSLACAVLLGSLSCAACSSDSSGSGESGGDGQGTLEEKLEAAGFAITPGSVGPFYVEDCEELPSCFASNASSPYGLVAIPPAPGTSAPPAGPDSVEHPKIPDGMSVRFTLASTEALLIRGRTPPPGKYYGHAPYIFDRVDPDTGERTTIFASLNDALNLTNLRTSTGDPFDAETTIIVTADQGTDEAVRAAVEASGGDLNQVNSLVLPSEKLRLGNASDADTLMVLQRFALFDDPAAGRAYLDSEPYQVLRLTPEGAEPSPFPPFTRKPRGTGAGEDHLDGALDALEAAISEAHSDSSVEKVPISAVGTIIDPERCLETLFNCLGDTSDTVYNAGPIAVVQGVGELLLSADPGDYFIAFGVNHEATGKATYSNVVVNHAAKQAGIASFESPDMPGSAAKYLPDHPDADQLFAVKITRDCAGEDHCVEVPTEFPGVPLDESLVFLFRAYLEPGKEVSTSWQEILVERVVHVTP